MQSHVDALTSVLDRTPMRALMNVPSAYLDEVMARAYQLYRAGKHSQAETLCRGLIALDPQYGWVYSLYASVLRRLGRAEEALVQIERGLRFEPGQPKLLAIKHELLLLLHEKALRAPASTSPQQGVAR